VGFLTNVGGFAVLQSHEPNLRFVLEKALPEFQTGTERQRRSQMIYDGDTVSVKVCNHNDVRYLSTHRGWWLKWVSTPPRHNGFFHITVQSETGEVRDEIGEAAEPVGPIVSLGAPFSLRHRRWKHYEVGVGTEASAKYGGKLLGLHRVIDDKGKFIDFSDGKYEKPDYIDGKGENQWLERLTLCANYPLAATEQMTLEAFEAVAAKSSSGASESFQHSMSLGLTTLDVSSWVETVHRTRRCRQRAYVVRVHQRKAHTGEDNTGKEDKSKWLIRIRTGRDLTPILQLSRSGLLAKDLISG